jgi:phosphate:Na+ symporter
MGATVLLDLLGGVSLLLWGLHMVQSGILRAFGSRIKDWFGRLLERRLNALLAGIGVTLFLQSSTATALMLSSFSMNGLVDLAPAIAVMLGANIGTTLTVQLLSFDSSFLAPLLLFAGLIAFKRGARTITRDLGRVAIGLGLMLLSLHILLSSLAPADNMPAMREILRFLTREPLLALLLGAALAWVAHSSVTTVLLAMSLAYSNFITLEAAMALVLGANLGSALNPVLEGASLGNPAHRRLPVANLATRVVGCLLFLPLIEPVAQLLIGAEPRPDAARLVADFHTLFNLAMAALFLLVLHPFAALIERLLPDLGRQNDPAAPLYLDEGALDMPPIALACAARETLHMGDIVETMLRQGMQAMLTNDRKLAAEVSRLDNAADRLHEAIKLYLVKLTRGSLEESEGRRAMEIMAFSVNLEHIGDIIDKNLMELANKKIKRHLRFSAEGQRELEELHRITIDNLKVAFSIFLSGDVRLARQLLQEKARIRELEMAAAESHIARLREGLQQSIETSSLHLDVLRDLKRIHSHICASAYPALDAAGELNPSRLKERQDARPSGAGPDAGFDGELYHAP